MTGGEAAMAKAPRKKTVKTEAELTAHRARQARYRTRLRETRTPESDDVQRIVFAVLRDITFEARQNRLPGDPVHQASVREFLLRLYKESLLRLERSGFNRKHSKRRLSLALTPPYPGPGRFDTR
jgi:hypothetical protein